MSLLFIFLSLSPLQLQTIIIKAECSQSYAAYECESDALQQLYMELRP